jgi:hypothetical protein
MPIPIPQTDAVELINSLHQVEADLIDRISKARGIRQRLFGIEDPEQAEFQLRNLATEAQVLAGSLVQIDDLDFQVRNFYPYPVAYAYRASSAIQEPTHARLSISGLLSGKVGSPRPAAISTVVSLQILTSPC